MTLIGGVSCQLETFPIQYQNYWVPQKLPPKCLYLPEESSDASSYNYQRLRETLRIEKKPQPLQTKTVAGQWDVKVWHEHSPRIYSYPGSDCPNCIDCPHCNYGRPVCGNCRCRTMYQCQKKACQPQVQGKTSAARPTLEIRSRRNQPKIKN